jgi:class 3 adenylate cyclase/tetratricopeptide (TPR) repeat protein
MSDIREWLEKLGLGQYAVAFETNRIDGDLLAHLNDQILKDIGVEAAGDRMRILRAVEALPDDGAPSPQPAAAKAPEAERRQITVMFCDLVGSTALSEALDPEDLRTLMQAYQQAAGAVIERYEGHVAQYLGDGLMTYFGWPQAHEDDAERAVRAGLEIVGAVKDVAAPAPLEIRVGIATGAVVVGETGGGDASVPQAAVGETPNLAARAQGVAAADEVIIAAGTRRLVGGNFVLDDLGAQALKGIVEPVRLFRVAAIAEAEDRFAARGARLTPLVGREAEIALVLGRWEQAKAGEGQVVLLSGEPGIGKSRITQTLRERVAQEPHTRLRYQCSPYYTNSALYPVVEQIERAAGFARSDDTDAKLDKLEAVLSDATVAPLIAAMLFLDIARYPPLAMSPQKQKDETLNALTEQVAAFSTRQPVLMIFEDAHWIDPTTQDLLDLLVPRVADLPVLLVVTYRPGFAPPWTGLGHVAPLALTRLGRSQASAMVERVTDGKTLPDEVLDQIVAKTDGVPLYVEELTKTVLEAGFLREEDDRYVMDGPLPPLAIPATLQDSLMARLDEMSPVKEVAQIGACIGREFPYDLLSAVFPRGDNELQNLLIELANSELVFRRGKPPDAAYSFKHALVQDAAYESLLKSKRQLLHAGIAKALCENFPDVLEHEPELIAHHYTRAGMSAQAVPYWLRAGKRAAEQSANAEAIAHFGKALDLLQDLPDNAGRAGQELSLHIDLVACMRISDRYDEALATLERAQEIATDLNRLEDLALIHNYRGNIYFPLGQFETCLEQHQLAADVARRGAAVEQEARALSGLGDAYYAQGQMIKSYDHFQACVDFCRQHGLQHIEAGNRYMVAWLRQYLNDFSGAAEEAVLAVEAALIAGDRRAEILARVAVACALSELGDLAGARAQIELGLAVVATVGALRFKPLYGIIENRIGLAEGKPRPQLASAMEDAFETARETGIQFVGPWVLSSLALVSDDPERRRQALAEAEKLFQAGSVGHNLAIYSDAIEISLADAAWDEVERYCTALADYTRQDPLPFTDFLIAYGRSLAAFGRGQRDEANIIEIARLKEDATRVGLKRSMPRLDQALAEAKSSA